VIFLFYFPILEENRETRTQEDFLANSFIFINKLVRKKKRKTKKKLKFGYFNKNFM
jgi:hypothetical protein